jgi:hypothetical protein
MINFIGNIPMTFDGTVQRYVTQGYGVLPTSLLMVDPRRFFRSTYGDLEDHPIPIGSMVLVYMLTLGVY